MKKLVCAFAILAAAAISTAAVAKELKQDQKSTAPGVSAAQMTDSEMDKVTAGSGEGIGTALENTDAAGNAAFGINTARPPFATSPGFGVCTAGRAVC